MKEYIERAKEVVKYHDTIVPNYTAVMLAEGIILMEQEINRLRKQIRKQTKILMGG